MRSRIHYETPLIWDNRHSLLIIQEPSRRLRHIKPANACSKPFISVATLQFRPFLVPAGRKAGVKEKPLQRFDVKGSITRPPRLHHVRTFILFSP